MKCVRSECKNPEHFVNTLKNTRVPPTSYLASLDTELLFTNISFDMAINVILNIFKIHPRLSIVPGSYKVCTLK